MNQVTQGPPGINGTNGAQGPPGITFLNNTNLYRVNSANATTAGSGATADHNSYLYR